MFLWHHEIYSRHAWPLHSELLHTGTIESLLGLSQAVCRVFPFLHSGLICSADGQILGWLFIYMLFSSSWTHNSNQVYSQGSAASTGGGLGSDFLLFISLYLHFIELVLLFHNLSFSCPRITKGIIVLYLGNANDVSSSHHIGFMLQRINTCELYFETSLRKSHPTYWLSRQK